MKNTPDFLHLDIANPWLLGTAEGIIVLVVVFFLLVPGNRLLTRLFRRFIHFFKKEPDEILVTGVHNAFKRIILLIAFDLVMSGFPLPRSLEDIVSDIIFVVVTLLILLSVFDLTNVAGDVLKVRAREFEPLITKVLKILTSTVALMVVMRHFNYDVWHIMTALGVGTLAVGLAAQPTLTNMIAGFTILIDRPFRPGDRISLSGGGTGDVIQIGMRSTRIFTPDGNLLVVSNSDMVTSRLTNFSMPNSHLASKVTFYVNHDAPLNDIKMMLKAALQNLPQIVKDSVKILAAGMNEWGVALVIHFNVEHFAQTSVVADHVTDLVITELRKRQIRFAVNPDLQPQ